MKKKIFSIWSVLLILVVSIAVVVPGCGDGATYDLTMAVAPVAGGAANDLTGTSPYTALTAVDIQAVPAATYQFCKWTTTGGIFVDPNAATTKFIMPAQNVTVTANFVGPLDHFKGYPVVDAPYLEGEYVTLKDQFVDDLYVQVKQAKGFYNPVEKTLDQEVTSISNPDHHFTVYSIYYPEEEVVMRSVEVSNQFGKNQTLSVVGPFWLAVPTQKVEPGDHEPPLCLDHFLVYGVEEGPEIYASVNLTDQFGPDKDVSVYYPYLFANPVQKTHGENVTEIMNEEHLVFYTIDSCAPPEPPKVEIVNQFGEQGPLTLSYPDLLAVPSEKIVPPTPPLDHFKCYQTIPEEPLGLLVNLQDQFHSDYLYDVLVLEDMMFCNPVDKVHGTLETSSNPDNHLTVYNIGAPTDWWTVTVDNQFNDVAAPQTLTVYGPVALAVPTQKLVPNDHGMPKYLDHYLLYEVYEEPGINVTATVDLDDQFPETAPGVTVTQPVYFANPVVKGYVDHAGLWDPDEHLVFYAISDNGEFLPSVTIKNQFFWEEGVPLDLSPIEQQLLAVPSLKVAWAPTTPPIQ